VIGEKAGMLLVVPKEGEPGSIAGIEKIVIDHGFTLERIEGNPHGTQIL